jgi:hypothetical protein
MKTWEPRTHFVCLCLLVIACSCAAASARGTTRATGENTAVPVVSIADASVGEGDGRNDGMNFVITLSEPSAQDVTVPYATQAVDATPGMFFNEGTDYNQTTGNLTIPAGTTWAVLNIGIVPDAIPETNETFKVTLSAPANAQLGDGEAVGTIIDDDGAAFTKVTFSADTFSVGEAAGKIDFAVTRTGDLSATTVVSFTTNTLGASERNDYTFSAGTLRFAPNETTKSFSVSITNDVLRENSEQFYIALYDAAGATLGKPSFAIVTIQDDDAADAQSPVRPESFDTSFFVRQHYLDFLGREPDAAGLAFWKNEIDSCGANAQCREVKRVNVSAAFFVSIEFQNTGYLVYKTRRAAFGNLPGKPVPVLIGEFMFDARQLSRNVIVGDGDWQGQLEQNKRDFFDSFVRTLTFPLIHPTTLAPAQFVDRLFLNAGVTPSAAERQAAIDEFGGAADTSNATARGRALRRVAENPALSQQEFNRAFVLMEYFGYLRRDPDVFPEPGHNFDGYNFWLGKLNEFGGDYVRAEMVKAFLSSDEYVKRFGL